MFDCEYELEGVIMTALRSQGGGRKVADPEYLILSLRGAIRSNNSSRSLQARMSSMDGVIMSQFSVIGASLTVTIGALRVARMRQT